MDGDGALYVVKRLAWIGLGVNAAGDLLSVAPSLKIFAFDAGSAAIGRMTWYRT